MTVRMVAPEPDMLSAVVHGMTYEIKKHDSLGRVVDVNDVHVPDFKAMGFKFPEELGIAAPLEIKTGPTQADIDAMMAEQQKLLDDQKAAAEKEAADKEAADKAEADKLAAEQEAADKAAADAASSNEPKQKGKGK